jgi:hypothetical protein
MDCRVKPGNDGRTCPGRGAAFFTLLRRAGTVSNTGARYGPGSAAQRFAKSYALRCVRGTHCTNLGVLLVLTGIGFLTGSMSGIRIWLLETFPALQNFG